MHSEKNETMADEIREHGHAPSAAEESQEAKMNARFSHNHNIAGPDEGRSTLKAHRVSEHDRITSPITGRSHEIMFGPQDGGNVPKNPFASLAQAGYMHSHPEVLGKTALDEWDAATKGKSLPKRVKKK